MAETQARPERIKIRFSHFGSQLRSQHSQNNLQRHRRRP
jgi:hypothetical protein